MGFFDSIHLINLINRLERKVQELSADLQSTTRKIERIRGRRQFFGLNEENAVRPHLERQRWLSEELERAQEELTQARERYEEEQRESDRKIKESSQALQQSLEDLARSADEGIKHFFSAGGPFENLLLMNPEARPNIIAAEKAKQELARLRGQGTEQPKQLEEPKKSKAEAILEKKLELVQCRKRYKEEIEKAFPDEPNLVKDLLDQFDSEFLEGEQPK